MTEPLDQLRLVTVAECASLRTEIERLAKPSQPLYVQVARLQYAFQYEDIDWPELYQFWPRYQFALRDDAGAVVAAGNSLPLACEHSPDELPDRGWDWCVRKGIEDYKHGTPPNTLAALFICVSPTHRGHGLGSAAISRMRTLAARHGLSRVIAPVRPSLKHRYPLTPIKDYVSWEVEPGVTFDPWLRSHLRVGGRLIRSCPESMTFTGKVAEWEEWVGMQFPRCGIYVVPEMLSTLTIDRERDHGVYVEPNVWVVHEVGSASPAGE